MIKISITHQWHSNLYQFTHFAFASFNHRWCSGHPTNINRLCLQRKVWLRLRKRI